MTNNVVVTYPDNTTETYTWKRQDGSEQTYISSNVLYCYQGDGSYTAINLGSTYKVTFGVE